MKSLYIVIVLLLTAPLITARPSYEFSDDVFKNLPDYPDDLEEISKLFAQNNIDIERLTPEYYLQPEFYPSWYSVHNIFYKSNKTHYGVYGFNIYPSVYDIFAKEGDTVNVVAFLNSNFGISIKTGVGVGLVYQSDIVRVERIQPKEIYFLLNETYPSFSYDWVQKLELKITVLKNTNTTISVYNTKPPDNINNYWKSLYGNSYTTTERLIEETPRLKINIYTPTPETPKSDEKQFNFDILETLSKAFPEFIIFLIFVIILIGAIIWKRKGR